MQYLPFDPKKRREIILGPPGTGKTRALIERLEIALSSGIPPEEVAFLAFTKKAANVAIQRAMKHFGFPRHRFPYFRTIHSLAFHENKIASMDVMRTKAYKAFGEEYGWDFTTSYDNLDERPQYGTGLGDRLLQCHDLAKARGITPLEEARRGEYGFTEFALEFFITQFERYKAKYGLLTFNDFLENAIDVDVQLVIIDEAQDLTRLQWSFIRRSFKNVPHIIIAGDDDQCIYEWSGADIEFFLNIEADVTTLGHSFRCKEEIWKMCNLVASKIGHRYPKKWEPVSTGGLVTFERDHHEIDISSGEWLIMARKNRNLRKFWQMAMASGRIFHDGHDWINQTRWFRGIRTYQLLSEGKTVRDSDIVCLMKVCPYVSKRLELIEYEWSDLEWKFEGIPPWNEACVGLKLEEKIFFERCYASNQDLDAPGEVKISTIHAAKGGEAENVVLDMKLDGIPKRQFKSNADAERRVWYVGVSRAKTKLILTGASRNPAIEI